MQWQYRSQFRTVLRLSDLDVGVKGEWRVCNCTILCVRQVPGSETRYEDAASGAKVTDNRVLLGLKLHMGDWTLQQTDRAGATLDIMSPLANPTSPLMFNPGAGRS